MGPFVSICIPAYKRLDFIRRLLDSIATQTCRDFEVVITDDSPDNSLAGFLQPYKERFAIQYHKNPSPLGTPANWNAAICLAKGKWIKIMHDDDWFTNEHSLQEFVTAAGETSAGFIFSGYYDVELEAGAKKEYVLTGQHSYLLKKSPYSLFKKNFIGHPSTTFIRNDISTWYNERLKWVVDIEFYIRLLREQPFHAIRKPLVCLGIGSEQVTKTAFRKPEVEIPENLYLLNKIGPQALHSILAYDYFWRLIRNLHIRDYAMIEKYRGVETVPAVIKTMIKQQQWLTPGMLRTGIISKVAMTVSYFYCSFTHKLK
jgi:glycosyltransferase involved in cell wall biosynthesis